MADLSPQDLLRVYQIGRNAEWRYRLGQYSDQALGQMLATLNKAKREILAVFEARYATIPEWDSIAHMSVIAALEDAFGIMIDMDDVIDMSSVGKAREIIAKYSPTG